MEAGNKPLHMLFTGIFLCLAAAACNTPAVQLGGPQPPTALPTADPAAFDSFIDKWESVNFSTPSGPFSVTFTEAELTAAMNEAVSQTDLEQSGLPPIENVQVVLQDNAIYTYAVVQFEPVAVNGVIIAVPSIGADGRVDITITSASFGPVELDNSLLQDIESAAEEGINAPIQSSPFDITLTGITIADHTMTVTGAVNP